MDLIGPELSELLALELENLPYLTLFTLLTSQILTIQYQTLPQYNYVPIRFPMSSIMKQIKPEHRELFALELGKIAESNFVYTLASTELFELFAFEFAKIAGSDFV